MADLVYKTHLVYKILRADEYSEASRNPAYAGSADDLRDGFIHFSSRPQLRGTAVKYFLGEENLKILEFSTDTLGEKLVWEPSTGGALYPHLYAPLDIRLALRSWPFEVPLRATPDFQFIERDDPA